MSSHQELTSLPASWEQSGSIIHTVNTAPLFLLLAPMDPEPTANPHAELVMECLGELPASESRAPDWSPVTPPDSMLARRSGWCGVEEPAVEKGDDFTQEGKIVDALIDEGCGEDSMLPSPWISSTRFIGQGGDPVGLGQQTIDVRDESKRGLIGGCALPSLKALGLDIYVRKQN